MVDGSGGKIFFQPDSMFCFFLLPYKIILKIARKHQIWRCLALQLSSWQINTGSMLRSMSSRAGITLTNHYDQLLHIRATSVATLSDAQFKTRFIKSITGYKSDQSIESCVSCPSINHQERMSTTLSHFLQPEVVACASLSQQSPNKTPTPDLKIFILDRQLKCHWKMTCSHTITIKKQSDHMTSGTSFIQFSRLQRSDLHLTVLCREYFFQDKKISLNIRCFLRINL